MKEEIIKILNAFVGNSYLVPSRHSDFLQFSNSGEKYQTYCNDERTYLDIEIKKDDQIIHKITAHNYNGKWGIAGENLFTAKTVECQLNRHYKYLKAIYDELHSLNAEDGILRIKEIRVKMAQKRGAIQVIEKEISILNQEIKDYQTKRHIL